MQHTTLTLGHQTVRIQAGELVGYAVDGHEFIHQKGNPGWRSADTEMFPMIGPTAEANFRVLTPHGEAIQDQHGLLRELNYERTTVSSTNAVYEKVYTTNTKVANSKYPAKSTAEHLSWPYDFRFRKTFELTPEGLRIEFYISGDAGMPFMLGYHPAFKLTTNAPRIKANGSDITLAEVLAVGSRALKVPDCTEVTLQDAKPLRIRTEGFGHFMCWTEVPNMVCIEPITFYHYDVPQAELHSGFQTLDEKESKFQVWITSME